MKKFKMIVAVIVAIVSITALVLLFCDARSTTFVLKKTPGVQWLVKNSFEIEVIESQKLDSLIFAKNVQIDSLSCIEQKSDADKILKSNYELIKNNYEQQKKDIEFTIEIKAFLMMLIVTLIYLVIGILSIVYIFNNIPLKWGKKIDV